jgi:hypothetical protein
MSKFTKGPWNLGAEDLEVFEKDGGMICVVRHPQDSPCIDVGDDGYAEAAEACEANANLIAAAPEMYEALQLLLGLIEAGHLVRDTSGDSESNWATRQLPLIGALSKSAAAIAKAEGKS